MEINFNDYVKRVGNLLDTPTKILNYSAISSRFQDEIDENGLQSSHFWEVLVEIESKQKNFGFTEINGYTINFESFDQEANFVAADFSINSIRDVAFLHFVRNATQDYAISYEYVIRNADQFVRVPDYQAAFHQIGSGNQNNVKWLSLDGKEEYIFRETTQGWKLVTDATNQGSYNYFPDQEDPFSIPDNVLNGHYKLDVDPWEFFGNFITDTTTPQTRTVVAPTDPAQEVQTISADIDQNGNIIIPSSTSGENVEYIAIGNTADNFIISGSGADVINGLEGSDTVSYALSTSGVTANLGLSLAYDGFGSRANAGENREFYSINERLNNIENLTGSQFADIFVGDNENNTLNGRAGIDRLIGMGGDDTLVGETGDDYLNGGAGDDKAVFYKDASEYTVTLQADGSYLVTFGLEQDVLVDIEQIQFADITLNLESLDGPIQSVSGQLSDLSGSSNGVVSLQSPTFMADGNTEYTVSLAGVGQGLQYNIAYIIDVSGSMGGQRIADAKNAYIELTNQLVSLGIADVANFAVIPFQSSATLFGDLTADEAISRISSLNTGGGTNFGSGISRAQTFFDSANTGQTNVAYFLSDGDGTGASSSLTSIANVQAFGIGSGANLGALNVIDSDDAKQLNSSAQLVDILTGSSVDADEIDRIEISLDGVLSKTVNADQLVNGPLGLQFTGTIDGLDISAGAINEISAVVFLKDGTQAGQTKTSVASALNGTSTSTSGDTLQVKFGASSKKFDVDKSGANKVELLGNDIDNVLISKNVGGTFTTFGGDDIFKLGEIRTSTPDRVIDGGEGFDIIEYDSTYSSAQVTGVGSVLRIGFNTDTITNVEEIHFSDGILDVETLEFSENINEIFGTNRGNNLIGTDGADAIRSLGGRYDKMTGNDGADQFIFGAETNNGVRERDVIKDYEVGVDSIVLEDGAEIGSIRETRSQVVIFFEDDRDAVYVRGQGVTADNIDIIDNNVLLDLG